MHKTKNEIVKE